MNILKTSSALLLLSLAFMLIACTPEVGSDEWCEDMKDKPKKEWTASEAAEYAKHCLFK